MCKAYKEFKIEHKNIAKLTLKGKIEEKLKQWYIFGKSETKLKQKNPVVAIFV